MKRNLKKLLSAVIFSSLATSSVCGAAYNLQYDGGESDFKLHGEAELKKAGQIVTLKVEKEGNLLYTRQTETGTGGTYSFVFNIAEYGEADITVSEHGVIKSGKLYKSKTEEITTALSRLNSNESESDIINDTEKKMDKILQVDTNAFNSLKESGLLTRYLAEQTFDSLPDFINKYKIGEFLVGVEGSTTVDEIYTLYKNFDAEEILGDYKATEIFEEYDLSEKKEILESVKGQTFTNKSAFQAAVLDQVIIKELRNMTTDNEKWSVLSENNDYLVIDTTKYENSNVFTDLKKELFEQPVASVSTLKDSIVSIYNELTDEATPGGGRGSNVGGKTDTGTVSNSLVSPQVPVTVAFSDIGNHEWAKSAILSLAADGVINGKASGIFAPDDYITRAEFTKIIIGAFGLLKTNAEADFADVTKDHWSYRFIASAFKDGVATGVTEDKFNPDGNITRQDMAVICHRILKKLNVKGEQVEVISFSDAEAISEYAKNAVNTLSSIGVINGKGNNTFAPKDFATRAEAAKIIYSLSLIK